MDSLFAILQDLQAPTWSERVYPSNASISSIGSSWADVSPPSKDKVWIHKVSGSLTNAVFFVLVPTGPREEAKSFQSLAPYKTLLLRIYGPHSSALINRAAELRVLYVLSSRYRIGPRVYGTFRNGRVEEYFESEPLTALELRDPQISRWIAVRMSELHRVDVRKVVDPVEWADPLDGTRGELGVKRNVRSWIPPAREVLKLVRDEAYKKEVDVDLFVEQWNKYYKWVRDWEKEDNCNKESPRVFCHNDTQYGNLLKLKHPQTGKRPHQQVSLLEHLKKWRTNIQTDNCC
jgi:choline kinase